MKRRVLNFLLISFVCSFNGAYAMEGYPAPPSGYTEYGNPLYAHQPVRPPILPEPPKADTFHAPRKIFCDTANCGLRYLAAYVGYRGPFSVAHAGFTRNTAALLSPIDENRAINSANMIWQLEPTRRGDNVVYITCATANGGKRFLGAYPFWNRAGVDLSYYSRDYEWTLERSDKEGWYYISCDTVREGKMYLAAYPKTSMVGFLKDKSSHQKDLLWFLDPHCINKTVEEEAIRNGDIDLWRKRKDEYERTCDARDAYVDGSGFSGTVKAAVTYRQAAIESANTVDMLESLKKVSGQVHQTEIDKDLKEFSKKKRKGYFCCTCKWCVLPFIVVSAVATVVGVILQYAGWFHVI